MSENLSREYNLLESIGHGRFSTVHRCISIATGDFYACKSVDKRLLDPTDLHCAINEPKLISHLPVHPHILCLHHVFEDSEHLHLITDLCDSPNLYDRLANSPISELKAASILRSILAAISHCHRHGVAHRDIKPENILFNDLQLPMLADFGSAEWFGEERPKMQGIVGTPYYVAPEIVMGKDYDEKVDVWSAGVVMYVMLSGILPFRGESVAETFEKVVAGRIRFPARVFHSVSAVAKDLIRKMVCRDSSRRISAEQALMHPWIQDGGMFSVTDLT